MQKPLLSVVVPVYKAEKYLHRCVNSILNQTLNDLELILVDDGSPDNSGAICDEYAKKDDRVRVVHKPNGGAASARNVGIDIANGEYIGFCDSDDYLNVNMYKELLDVLKENNLDSITCLSNTRDESGNLVSSGISDKKLKHYNKVEYIKKIYLWDADVSLCTRISKTEKIKQIRIPEKRRVEDFFFTICLLHNLGKTSIYNYPFYEYTVNTNSVTHSADSTIYMDGLYFFEKSKELLCTDEYSLEQEHFKYKMLSSLFISLKKAEYKKYKYQLKYHKKYVTKNIFNILKNPYIRKKEKIALFLTTINLRLPSFVYMVKNLGELR